VEQDILGSFSQWLGLEVVTVDRIALTWAVRPDLWQKSSTAVPTRGRRERRKPTPNHPRIAPRDRALAVGECLEAM
jgi:hypothetical protein